MKRVRRSILLLWLLLLISFWGYTRVQGLEPVTLLAAWLGRFAGNPLAPLMLLAAYLVRPLMLLPITILTLASGFLFGASWGFVYATFATLLSSALAYTFGRFFGMGSVSEGKYASFITALRDRSFETVLFGRLLFLPGDLINYAAGFFRVRLEAFLAATALGGVPGLLIGVLAGAAIEGDFHTTGLSLNLPYLLASAGIFVFSLGLSLILRRRVALEAHAPKENRAVDKR